MPMSRKTSSPRTSGGTKFWAMKAVSMSAHARAAVFVGGLAAASSSAQQLLVGLVVLVADRLGAGPSGRRRA
jgi:hypothetical protein